jgi:cytochrome c
MKITYLLLSVAMITLTSFSKESKEEKYTKKTEAVYQASNGEKLIAKIYCVCCHKLDKKIVGTAYLDIAKKYSLNDKNINYLSAKIIKGGSGVWGSIPMAAHPSLKKEDAKTIATYILSLKK